MDEKWREKCFGELELCGRCSFYYVIWVKRIVMFCNRANVICNFDRAKKEINIIKEVSSIQVYIYIYCIYSEDCRKLLYLGYVDVHLYFRSYI